MKNKSLEMTGYYDILKKLENCASTKNAKEKIQHMEPILSEAVLLKNMRDTSQARQMLEEYGTPPVPIMEHVEEYLDKAVRSELLLPEQLEQLGLFLNAVKRLKSYLEKGESRQISLAFYNENLIFPIDLREQIENSIRGGKVDDYASTYLLDIRKQLIVITEKMNQKAEKALSANKSYLSDNFVVKRNGRLCIPVKKDYKSKIAGSIVEKSATGFTLFMEPDTVAELREEFDFFKLEEDSEERRILYTLMSMVAAVEKELRENIRIISMLDFVFSKGKLSAEMDAIEPLITTGRSIRINNGRHPLLEKSQCVPLDFEIGNGINGVIITGPNTGGKTVAIKTVALLSAMACSGLHIPCTHAEITMNSQILCDIGDGQNMADNLSTFSAHMTNVIDILSRINSESLIIMDELGSGTDPAEGMGIAISILEQLRKSHALFLVTTHYPEVKEYAESHPEIINARMEFDKESLKPLYQLKIGASGESCALYIAKRLGIPNEMLRIAAKEAYGSQAPTIIETLGLTAKDAGFTKKKAPHIQPIKENSRTKIPVPRFSRGDSVTVLPEKKIGIVVVPEDEQGNVLVQIQKEKLSINQKRLKLKVAASQLYPEDYDFSIIFDTVEHRKARHVMDRKHQEGLHIEL